MKWPGESAVSVRPVRCLCVRHSVHIRLCENKTGFSHTSQIFKDKFLLLHSAPELELSRPYHFLLFARRVMPPSDL